MSGDSIYSQTKHRLLPDPGLRAERVDSHPVVGVLLDQRRRVTGPRLHRSADRSHYDDDERRRSSHFAESLVHQSHRRLDDRLYVSLSLCDSLRICLCLSCSSMCLQHSG